MEGGRDKKRKNKLQHKVSLATQVEQERDGEIRPKKKIKIKIKKTPKEEFLSSKSSKQLLSQARAQLKEENEENGDDENEVVVKEVGFKAARGNEEDLSDEELSDDGDGGDGSEDEYTEDMHMDEEDERVLNMFMASGSSNKKTLSEVISEKTYDDDSKDKRKNDLAGLDPEVVAVYTKVARVMKTPLGKLPQAIAHLPDYENWEKLLFITKPEQWSPQALLLTTQAFVRKNKEMLVQRFLNIVLLPALLEGIFHNASGECTLREAVIIGSAIKRCSFPVLHASVALLKIAQMPYSVVNSHFLLLFLDKKYSLPYRVIDAMVEHFMKFVEDTRILPVLWHQCLLVFVKGYSTELSAVQKDRIKYLVTIHKHHKITMALQQELRK